MSRSWLTAAVALSVAAGCSHQQKVETKPPVARATPPAPAPKVAEAPPAPDVPEAPKAKEDDAVFFDFDSSLVREDARPVLQKVARDIRKRNASLEIEGNCDELGTTEYNLALGEHRARAAKEYLVRLGVPSAHIATVSYGSQRPKYSGHSDEDRARNRRDDFVVR
jgi:peptidoglycan-associated lipoprotein